MFKICQSRFRQGKRMTFQNHMPLQNQGSRIQPIVTLRANLLEFRFRYFFRYAFRGFFRDLFIIPLKTALITPSETIRSISTMKKSINSCKKYIKDSLKINQGISSKLCTKNPRGLSKDSFNEFKGFNQHHMQNLLHTWIP